MSLCVQEYMEISANDGMFLFQLIAAGACGALVGMERQSRMKSAGVRTHIVVALASALMMIVSKYGFLDVISVSGTSVDISRVAAGIISGIGILGGGLIFIGKQGLVSGMTTAAGIWMTVGIGMAMGSGLYALGFEGTVLILLMQYFFHKKVDFFTEPLRAQAMFLVGKDNAYVKAIIKKLEDSEIEINRVKVEKKDENTFYVKCYIILPRSMSRDDFTRIISGFEGIIAYEV